MQQTILTISGKPGLFKLLTRGNKNLIVESLDDSHRRMPAFATDRITSLNEIAIYTDNEDVPLMDVLEKLKAMENGKPATIDIKKASGDDLRTYFGKVLPEFDRERVHVSDIKKLISWYDILVKVGITDFKEEEATEEEATKEEAKEPAAEEAVPEKKATEKKATEKKSTEKKTGKDGAKK